MIKDNNYRLYQILNDIAYHGKHQNKSQDSETIYQQMQVIKLIMGGSSGHIGQVLMAWFPSSSNWWY